MSKRKRGKKQQKEEVLGSKTCPRCKNKKSMNEFGKRNKVSNLWHSWCRTCRIENSYLRKSRAGYKLENAQYMREYRKRKL